MGFPPELLALVYIFLNNLHLPVTASPPLPPPPMADDAGQFEFATPPPPMPDADVPYGMGQQRLTRGYSQQSYDEQQAVQGANDAMVPPSYIEKGR